MPEKSDKYEAGNEIHRLLEYESLTENHNLESPAEVEKIQSLYEKAERPHTVVDLSKGNVSENIKKIFGVESPEEVLDKISGRLHTIIVKNLKNAKPEDLDFLKKLSRSKYLNIVTHFKGAEELADFKEPHGSNFFKSFHRLRRGSDERIDLKNSASSIESKLKETSGHINIFGPHADLNRDIYNILIGELLMDKLFSAFEHPPERSFENSDYIFDAQSLEKNPEKIISEINKRKIEPGSTICIENAHRLPPEAREEIDQHCTNNNIRIVHVSREPLKPEGKYENHKIEYFPSNFASNLKTTEEKNYLRDLKYAIIEVIDEYHIPVNVYGPRGAGKKKMVDDLVSEMGRVFEFWHPYPIDARSFIMEPEEIVQHIKESIAGGQTIAIHKAELIPPEIRKLLDNHCKENNIDPIYVSHHPLNPKGEKYHNIEVDFAKREKPKNK
jgi:hypothetical protein